MVQSLYFNFCSTNYYKALKLSRLMRSKFKKRLLRVCCYLLTASVAFSPVVHAFYMSATDMQTEQVVHENQPSHFHAAHDEATAPCPHQQLEAADASENCDHDSGLSCKILCTVSICTIPVTSIESPAFNIANLWRSDQVIQRIQSIFLALFKPPRI